MQKGRKRVIKTECSAGPSWSLGWGFTAVEFVRLTGGTDSLFALGTEVFPGRELILGGGGGRRGGAGVGGRVHGLSDGSEGERKFESD